MFDVVREYKITVRTQFKQAQNLLFLLIMFIVGCVITYYVAEDKILTAIKISVVLFIPQLAGWFIQHANFYSANKCDVFKVDNKGRMEFIHSSDCITFYDDNVEKVEHHMSVGKARKGAKYLVWDNYQFWIIHLEDGTKITLTCLMFSDEINMPINSNKFKNDTGLILMLVSTPSLKLPNNPS